VKPPPGNIAWRGPLHWPAGHRLRRSIQFSATHATLPALSILNGIPRVRHVFPRCRHPSKHLACSRRHAARGHLPGRARSRLGHAEERSCIGRWQPRDHPANRRLRRLSQGGPPDPAPHRCEPFSSLHGRASPVPARRGAHAPRRSVTRGAPEPGCLSSREGRVLVAAAQDPRGKVPGACPAGSHRDGGSGPRCTLAPHRCSHGFPRKWRVLCERAFGA